MAVYVIKPDSDTFDSIMPVRSDDWDIFAEFDGRRLADSWKPVACRIYRVGRSGDFPSLLNHVPVFSERAWQALEPLLRGYVEALPLETEEGRFLAINVLELLDCLDETRSEVERLPDGHIIFIDRYVFREDCLGDTPMFKLPQLSLTQVLVSERFKSAVEEHGLEGLIFQRAA
jgi:hypothetical protein